MNFEGRDIVTIKDYNRIEIEHILEITELMEPLTKSSSDILKGKILANIFLEPSTRTRLSFEAAILRLGGSYISISEARTSAIEKGENLVDTISVMENYVDIIALRHSLEGAARLAAEVANIPVINAGSGAGEHPTQALLDLYTIKKERGKIDGLNIAILGDLKYGRTTHSLAYALSLFKTTLYFVSPESLKMRREVLEDVSKRVKVIETKDVPEIIPKIDVLYVTRMQKERFPDLEVYEKIKGTYRIDLDSLRNAKRNMIVMHPLPRIDEIAPEIDQTTNAKYFKQVWYGLVTRMALLSLALGAIK
ncbi:aspartate carbamoyltransferase [Candidatus Bathyarchaeota archaeon]|nr:MAG: aspartate carbamoyltransferase [Candidatus Bathyarchaeota archaeon]